MSRTWEAALKIATKPGKPEKQKFFGNCGHPLTGRQRSVCGGRCAVALHRKNQKAGIVPPPTPRQRLPVTPVTEASTETRDAIERLAGGPAETGDV